MLGLFSWSLTVYLLFCLSTPLHFSLSISPKSVCACVRLSSPQPHSSCVPQLSKEETASKPIHTMAVHQLSLQIWDQIRGTSAFPSIYKLCIVATHFIFLFPEYSTHGHDYPLPVWWRPFLRDLGSLHAFITTRPYIFPVAWWCSGSAATIPGSIQIYNTVSFVATYQHQPHLFNSDLEGEVSGWVEVLMVQFSSHWICWTKETMETNSPPRDTWIITDKTPPSMVLLPWIISLCEGLDQLVNLSTTALN